MTGRQIILDTETTGLESGDGHRIIEIGCIEIRNRRRSDRVFHQYLDPQRAVEEGAFEVHGISNEMLVGKPLFADIAQELLDFIRDSEIIIHNAPFDVGFLNAELKLLGRKWGRIEDYCRITDTLVMARELHPGQKNSLDALCTRYQIDNSQRDLHGALLDAQILLDVYLAMTGGQSSLSLGDERQTGPGGTIKHTLLDRTRGPLRCIQPTPEELQLHRLRLEAINKDSSGKCVWLESGEQ